MADWLCSNARASPCKQPDADDYIPPSTLYERMSVATLLARSIVSFNRPVLGRTVHES
jgi:hypothetical protein